MRKVGGGNKLILCRTQFHKVRRIFVTIHNDLIHFCSSSPQSHSLCYDYLLLKHFVLFCYRENYFHQNSNFYAYYKKKNKERHKSLSHKFYLLHILRNSTIMNMIEVINIRRNNYANYFYFATKYRQILRSHH